MDAQPMKLGTPVYVVVRVSKYITNIVVGRIIAWEADKDEWANSTDKGMICYVSEVGLVYFADRTLCYPNMTAAENRKREIERETQ